MSAFTYPSGQAGVEWAEIAVLADDMPYDRPGFTRWLI
jgi:hypothetical protein